MDAMPISNTIGPYMRKAHDIADWKASLAGRIAFVTGALAVVGTVVPPDYSTAAFVLSMVLVLGVISERVLFHWYRQQHAIAESIRRRFHLAEGLLGEVPESYLAWLRKKYGNLPADSDLYYDSDCSVGARRLVENTLESAFWTEHLHDLESRRYLVLSLVFLVTFLIALITLVRFVAPPGQLPVGNVVLAVLSSSYAYGLWSKWWDYRRTHLDAEKVYDRCLSVLKTAELNDSDTFGVFSDYSAVTLSAIPINRNTYQKHRNLLNEEWANVKLELNRYGCRL